MTIQKTDTTLTFTAETEADRLALAQMANKHEARKPTVARCYLQTLALFADGNEWTALEVADALGIERTAANNRLTALCDMGALVRRSSGEEWPAHREQLYRKAGE